MLEKSFVSLKALAKLNYCLIPFNTELLHANTRSQHTHTHTDRKNPLQTLQKWKRKKSNECIHRVLLQSEFQRNIFAQTKAFECTDCIFDKVYANSSIEVSSLALSLYPKSLWLLAGGIMQPIWINVIRERIIYIGRVFRFFFYFFPSFSFLPCGKCSEILFEIQQTTTKCR